MIQTIEGQLISKGKKYSLICSRFNEFITQKLLDGAIDALKRHSIDETQIEIIFVPGAFEIPLIAQKIGMKKQSDAIICLAAVIRGATPHFDYIAGEVTKGIAKVGLSTGIPVSFGIITADTIEQAIERAGTKDGNKGFDAALTAIEMVNLIEKIG